LFYLSIKAMNCIYCDAPLPEKGFFCPACFKQVKCRQCNEALLKDTKICIFCGEEIGKKSYALNINTIEFSETETDRKFKASFTDTVGQSISDSFGLILANKVGNNKKLPPSIPSTNLPPEQSKTEEVQAEIITETTNPVQPELVQLKRIFKEDGDKVSLLETRLKAKSKRDYAIRLTLIYLYYKHLCGIDNVPRNLLTAILDDSSVEDGNFRFWLGNNPLVGVINNTVHIKAGGKDSAKKYLIEINNPEIKDKWQIGTTSKFGRKPKDKKEKTK
jgi:hypothetical protein